MTLYDFLAKYGTHTVSITLRAAAEAAERADPIRWNLTEVEAMAKGLEQALTHFQLSNKPAAF